MIVQGGFGKTVDYDKIKAKLRAAAPTTFAEPGSGRRQLKLVVEGETFQWKLKK